VQRFYQSQTKARKGPEARDSRYLEVFFRAAFSRDNKDEPAKGALRRSNASGAPISVLRALGWFGRETLRSAAGRQTAPRLAG
jgi:hypothetical protein